MIDDGSYTWGIWTCSTPAKTTDIKAYAVSIGIESVDTTIAGLTGTVYSNYSGTPTDYTNAYSSTGMITTTTSANSPPSVGDRRRIRNCDAQPTSSACAGEPS